MAATRSVRWAEVEYQPNLVIPTQPVPLGIVAEEFTKDERVLIFLGRVPKGGTPDPDLQFEEAWGPFRDVLAQWTETFSKNVREFVDEIAPDDYALDELAQRWKWNVYIKEPKTASSSASLDSFAKRRFNILVRESEKPANGAKSVRKPARKAVPMEDTARVGDSLRRDWFGLKNQLNAPPSLTY